MQLVEIDPVAPDPAVIDRAAALLRAGRLVAFPTETVYGLGANALDSAAVDRIYTAKGRPAYNPLIVHVANAARALDVVREWTATADALASAFWPGPLTLVLRKRDEIPDGVTAGLSSVAVRVPRHAVAQALLEASNLPIAAPSANRSMMLSPTTGVHVASSLGDVVDLILDAGPTVVGIESTVLDLTTATPTLLRPGSISVPEIEAVIGAIAIATSAKSGVGRASPGMMDRHYSPRARLLLVDAADVAATLDHERGGGRRVGALVVASLLQDAGVTRMPRDAAGYAAQIYNVLHALDNAGYDVIVVERVPDGAEWLGVRDRLERAARS
ncbi:MAG: translation factor [Gemmatimonadetes bacterium]|nr:translation factor [Gemmatimonadota bacterium]